MVYQIIESGSRATIVISIKSIESDGSLRFIPLDPANTDYQQFKYEINHDEAGLEDADGVLMTPEEAKAYVATLP